MVVMSGVAFLLLITFLVIPKQVGADRTAGTLYRLLSAKTENWGLVGPGMWSEKTWNVYSDGSYEFLIDYVPDEDEQNRPTSMCGVMSSDGFAKLMAACDCELMDLEALSFGDDGQGWQIAMYAKDGSILRSTGEVRCVYGQENVERIIRLLPE